MPQNADASDTRRTMIEGELPASIAARAASGQRSMLKSHGLRVSCKIASVVIVARLVGPADHGLFAMAASLTLLLTLFRDLGLGSAAVGATQVDEDERTTLLWAHVIAGCALALLTLGLIPALVVFYREPRLVPLAAAMSLNFVFLGINAWPRVLLARDLRFAELNRAENVAVLVSTASMIAVAAAGGGPYAFVTFLLTFEGALMLASWRACAWRPSGRRDWRKLAPFLRQGMPLTGYQFVAHLSVQLDTFAVGKWFGPGVLGLYSRAAQLLLLPAQHIATPLGQVLLSSLSRIARTAPEFREQLRSTTRLTLYLTLPLAACCIVTPRESILLVLGSDWVSAAPLLRWLAVIAIFASSTAALAPLCVALGRTRRLLVAGLASLFANGTALLIARGDDAVFLVQALAAANALSLIPRLWLVTHGSPARISDFLAPAFGPAVSAAALSAGLLGARALVGIAQPFCVLASGLAVGSALVFGIAAAWPRLRSELRQVWQQVSPRRTALRAS